MHADERLSHSNQLPIDGALDPCQMTLHMLNGIIFSEWAWNVGTWAKMGQCQEKGSSDPLSRMLVNGQAALSLLLLLFGILVKSTEHYIGGH